MSLLKEQGLHRGRGRPPAGELRGGRPVRPDRGHPPGAPEPTHALKVAIDEAHRGEGGRRGPPVILFNLCGHGHFDLSAYERFLSARLEDYEYPAEKVEERSSPPKVRGR